MLDIDTPGPIVRTRHRARAPCRWRWPRRRSAESKQECPSLHADSGRNSSERYFHIPSYSLPPCTRTREKSLVTCDSGVSRTSYGGGTCGIPCGKPLDPAANRSDRGGSSLEGRLSRWLSRDHVVEEGFVALDGLGVTAEPGAVLVGVAVESGSYLGVAAVVGRSLAARCDGPSVLGERGHQDDDGLVIQPPGGESPVVEGALELGVEGRGIGPHAVSARAS